MLKFLRYEGHVQHTFTAASDNAYQLLAHGQWFSLGTPASSTTKTGPHDMAEILLKVALNTKNQSINYIFHLFLQLCQVKWVKLDPQTQEFNLSVIKLGSIPNVWSWIKDIATGYLSLMLINTWVTRSYMLYHNGS